MSKQIRLNAFAMNCVAHQSPGLWTHPRDRTLGYNRLPYWLDLAKTLERGRFDGLFLADVLGTSDSRVQPDGKHHVLLQEFGYRWYRVGGLNYALQRERNPAHV